MKVRTKDYWIKRTSATAVRIALTGQKSGADLEVIMRLLGDEEVIRRLEIYDNALSELYKKRSSRDH